MSRKYVVGALISILLVLILAVVAGAAAPVAPGAAVPAAVVGQDEMPPAIMAAAQPETCSVCHKDAGAAHQASYDELYQDGVIEISDLAYSFTEPDMSTVSFMMTKNGTPFDVREADSWGIYFAPYTESKFQFEPAIERLSLKGELTYDGAGMITSVVTGTTDFSAVDGIVVVYGADETLGRLPARIRQVKYPFAAIFETGAGVDYLSAANNDGCETCHTDPYLKHGYIYGQVDGDPGTDFYTCKACHLDNGEGGHFEWQLLVDDPALAAEYLAGNVELTEEQIAAYAYPTTLMNDVHMSHAMEFPYPQSMSNCTTCHAGKLDTVLADENFNMGTCKSCHAMTGSEEHGTAELALMTIIPASKHEDMDLATEDCTRCHAEGELAPTFKEIHSGYDKVIYTADGMKYSEAIMVTVDSAAFDGTSLTIGLSAVESPDIEGLDVADILPTVMVGMYGWDSKDFVIGAHERLTDDNGDGEISRASGDQRALEYEVGAEHPRFTTVSAEGGSWEVIADMSLWTDLVTDGTVTRVEIGVMPELVNADDMQLALDATSRTFDLTTNTFVDDFYSPIVKAVDGCNNCHEALATTFHSPDRGGSIVVCRMCHITKSGGSHLELQSRSIDSYAHAIHSFQAFDIGDIDFNDPVAALEYEHHIEFPYPTHGVTNCESCHMEGTYNVPDQSKSLPGILSASDPIESWDRNIGEIPSTVVGPAARACGGCHQAELINEDAVVDLVVLNQHMKQGGYSLPAGDDSVGVWAAAVDMIMSLFK